MTNTNTKARELANSFVESQTDHAQIWRFEREQLPGLPASAICIVTVSIRHKAVDALGNGAKLLDAVKVKDTE